MRFRFDPGGERAGGIRLIDEIPDHRICHLEGRNGAGKSLALRLLELISGYQPYRTTPGAWSSLRENLGETTVTIAGLDGKTLRVDLKPQHWKQDPEPVGDWLGTAFLDDSPLPIDSIKSLLRVIRIAGDETFERTIRLRLEAEYASIERAHRYFERKHLQLVELLDRLADDTSAVDIEQREQSHLDSIVVSITATELDLRSWQERIAILNDAVLAKQRLAALADKLPNIEHRLAQLTRESNDLNQRLSSAQDRQATLLADLAGGSDVDEQVQEVHHKRDMRLRRAQRLANKAQTSAAQLRVSSESEAVATALTEAKAALKQVESEQASTSRHASVRELTSRVGTELDARRELDREVVAVLNSEAEGLRLTASELRTAIQRRQVELAEVEDDPLLRELNERAKEISRRILQLGLLRKFIRDHDRARNLLRQSEDELGALVGHAKAAGELRTEYTDITAQVAAIEEELRERLAEETRLRVQADQLSAGKSAEELREQLTIVLHRLQLEDESAVDQCYNVAVGSADEQRARLRQLRTEQLELQSSLALRESEITQVVARLSAAAWLPLTVRQALVRSDEGRHALLALRNAASSVRESLYRVRNRFDQLIQAARLLAREVGRREEMSDDVALVAELADEIGDRLRSEFDQDEIRIALFDEGQLESIDLKNLEARWITKGGERRTRPFEAFSSGEQVFAYTRARIERVSSIVAEHKVIALDEFGAFLARDRLERLARYLREAVLGSIADQVIIVVPLAADYRAQAASTTGELHKRFEHRAAEIERHSYFTEDATQRELV